ncbi:protein SGT1-like [Citrus sinensis]|uniref:Protein SGT1-like n=1 Tax=Citrus sinensis TaxID=2711 RepID=A0ACB8HS12_CITSI|nr:protein SGT1-like [Citrus sinensis]
MATDLEKKAKEAFIDDYFELAYDLYSQAIEISPNSAELFADRAQASIKLQNFTEAVADANRAIELEPSMSKAYWRKAWVTYISFLCNFTACMKLEEYETAKVALEKGASLAPGDSRFTNLIKECEERIAEETGELQKQPLETGPTNVVSTNNVQPATNISSTEDVETVMDVSNEAAMAAPARPKYRHEFYQKPEEVVVTVFAKGIPAKNVTVDFGEQILSVSIDVPGEEAYHFQPRLFGKIIPAKCRYEVLSTKVEIRLAKAEPIQWSSLEFSKGAVVPQRVNPPSVSGSPRPTYPSSKPTRVDWDKLEAQVKKEEKEEKLDGDAALNKFFQEIYADADEDTRRAMKKSFVESNGTVLSTNWKEVGSKKVEGSPPDGMEMKKWEY